MPPELQGPYIPAMIVFVVSSFMTVSAAWDLIDGLRSLDWPGVEGRTVGHGVSLGSTRYAVDDSLVIAYVYTVDGVQYQGLRFDYAGRNTLGRSAKLLKTYGPGRSVRVFYDPKRPDRAVLQPGVGTWTIVPLLVGGLVMLISGTLTHEAISILLAL